MSTPEITIGIDPSTDTRYSTSLRDKRGKVANETVPADDQSTSTTTTRLSENHLLLSSLSRQLDYYFSQKNLSQDTYLRTIMELNSGHVPVSILSNFANVNRIISTGLSTQQEDLKNTNVEWLVRQAAIESDLLEVVRLNQNGNVISRLSENDAASMKREDYTPPPEESGKPTFVAIGPSPLLLLDSVEGLNISDTENKDNSHESRAQLSVQKMKKSNQTKNSSCNIIILRDVPEDATENDIRSIFQNKNPEKRKESLVTNVQREVGQCWFVTLDPEANQQDIFDILLDLRNKKIMNETVKARLKTHSMVLNSKDNSSSLSHQDNSSPFGANNNSSNFNSNYSSNLRSKTSTHRNISNHIYSGDRMYHSTRRNDSGGSRNGASYSTNHGKFKYDRFNSRNALPSSSSFVSNKGTSGATGDDHRKKLSSGAQAPPPPLVDEHYPSLGIPSPKSTIVSSEEQDVKEQCEPSIAANQRVHIGRTVATKNNVGYAAAVLKAISSTNATVATSDIVSMPEIYKKDPRTQQKKIAQKSIEVKSTNESSKALTMSTAADDLSSDDKSSLSSKPESEKGTTSSSMNLSTQVVVGYDDDASKKWGGGRSFADILKNT